MSDLVERREDRWIDWELSERELMEIANRAIFYNRPDLQFKFDGSAPPLLPALQTLPPSNKATG